MVSPFQSVSFSTDSVTENRLGVKGQSGEDRKELRFRKGSVTIVSGYGAREER